MNKTSGNWADDVGLTGLLHQTENPTAESQDKGQFFYLDNYGTRVAVVLASHTAAGLLGFMFINITVMQNEAYDKTSRLSNKYFFIQRLTKWKTSNSIYYLEQSAYEINLSQA